MLGILLSFGTGARFFPTWWRVDQMATDVFARLASQASLISLYSFDLRLVPSRTGTGPKVERHFQMSALAASNRSEGAQLQRQLDDFCTPHCNLSVMMSDVPPKPDCQAWFCKRPRQIHVCRTRRQPQNQLLCLSASLKTCLVWLTSWLRSFLARAAAITASYV